MMLPSPARLSGGRRGLRGNRRRSGFTLIEILVVIVVIAILATLVAPNIFQPSRRVPSYAYQAVDGSGKRMRGQAQALSPNALTRTLEERGLLVLDVAESSASAAAKGGVRFGRRREVLEVTRAMAALLPVG